MMWTRVCMFIELRANRRKRALDRHYWLLLSIRSSFLSTWRQTARYKTSCQENVLHQKQELNFCFFPPFTELTDTSNHITAQVWGMLLFLIVFYTTVWVFSRWWVIYYQSSLAVLHRSLCLHISTVSYSQRLKCVQHFTTSKKTILKDVI